MKLTIKVTLKEYDRNLVEQTYLTDGFEFSKKDGLKSIAFLKDGNTKKTHIIIGYNEYMRNKYIESLEVLVIENESNNVIATFN